MWSITDGYMNNVKEKHIASGLSVSNKLCCFFMSFPKPTIRLLYTNEKVMLLL